MKSVIVNVACGQWYPKGQKRLIQSLRQVEYEGSLLTYTNALPFGSPTHVAAPYHFKTFALLEARKAGYQVALWLDASMWAARRVEPLLERVATNGYLLWRCDAFSVGQWCSDAALKILEVDRDTAMTIPLVTGGIVGLNFENEKANRLLDEAHRYGQAGAFCGPWDNKNAKASADTRVYGHRHDQSVLGVLCHRLDISLVNAPDGFAYAYETDPKPRDSRTVFIAAGM